VRGGVGRRKGAREGGKSITIVENICRGPERGGPGAKVRDVKALECERKGTHAFKGAHDDDEETVGGDGVESAVVPFMRKNRATQLRV